jgi:DNA adenine methylase
LSCLLAKIHKPDVDIRKPYTEIGGSDSYSGRTYDEGYVSQFIAENDLPCNPTTAFLTPALRNRNSVLTPNLNLVGRPAEVYQYALDLLTAVHSNQVAADKLLAEVIRHLLIFRDERKHRLASMLDELKASHDSVPLSAEAIISLIEKHLSLRGASRLPVLVVAGAYSTVSDYLKERVLPLESHTAADQQTGALGDLQITVLDDDEIITSYEMKTNPVTTLDIDHALQKIVDRGRNIDNYIFITTAPIQSEVQEYARNMYEQTGGIEFVILDCIGFLRHFLHLFHRLRLQYVETYQKLLLAEPNSAVSQPLKEAFLALRRTAEANEV